MANWSPVAPIAVAWTELVAGDQMATQGGDTEVTEGGDEMIVTPNPWAPISASSMPWTTEEPT